LNGKQGGTFMIAYSPNAVRGWRPRAWSAISNASRFWHPEGCFGAAERADRQNAALKIKDLTVYMGVEYDMLALW